MRSLADNPANSHILKSQTVESFIISPRCTATDSFQNLEN